MNLYLLRHGLAVEPGTAGFRKDFERPLTPEGKQKLRSVAKAIKALDLYFDLILSSPYIRARQTAELVAKSLKASERLELLDALAPDGNIRKLVKLLEGLAPPPQEILLVGHEPYMSSLISRLVYGQPGARVVMKKGGLCKLSVGSIEHGRCASLEWLLTPKQMGLMK